jgi:hypothetical protein
MASSNIYLVMDAGGPVIASTDKHKLTVCVRRRLDTFINPLVHTFGDGHAPHSATIMTLSRVLAD